MGALSSSAAIVLAATSWVGGGRQGVVGGSAAISSARGRVRGGGKGIISRITATTKMATYVTY